jgi:hypothetical protein
VWAEPVRQYLDRRPVGGEDGERTSRKDGWKAEEGGAVVCEAMIEQTEMGDIINHKDGR